MIKFKILIVLFFSTFLYAQNTESQSYDLDFLAAKYVDSLKPKQIILIFKYQPKPGKKFEPVISMRITYKLGDENKEKTEIFDKNGKFSIVAYDKKIKDKAPQLYKLIKDKMNIDQEEEYGIIVFYLNGITKKYVDKMTFKYGLWEPDNIERRIEKDYDIAILR